MGFPVLGAVLGGIGLLGGRASANRTTRKQNQAIREWIAYQDAAKDTAETAVDANRNLNYGTLGDLLAGADQTSRENLIADETDRLYGLMTAPEYTGAGTTSFEARKLAEATQEARDMIRANAKTRAYGNSYGGMGTVRDRAMREGAADIGFNNEMSLGDLSVLQKRQTVQPVMYQHQSTGLGDLMSNVGFGMVGDWAGTTFSGGGATPTTATTGSAWRPPTTSAWRPPAGPVAPTPALSFGGPSMGYMFPPSANLRFR